MLTHSEYLNILRTEGDAFADSVQIALTAPVVSCEPWVGTDLLWHMVEVHCAEPLNGSRKVCASRQTQ